MTIILKYFCIFAAFIIKESCFVVILDNTLTTNTPGLSYNDLDYLLTEIAMNNTNEALSIQVVNSMIPFYLSNPVNLMNLPGLMIFLMDDPGSFSLVINSSYFSMNCYQTNLTIINSKIILNNTNVGINNFNSSIFNMSEGSSLNFEVQST